MFLTTAISDSSSATIKQFNNVAFNSDEYSFSFVTSDGQERAEKRTVLNKGTQDEKVIVEGHYKYVGDDGKDYTVNYVADKYGFHPESKHLVKVADVKKERPQPPIVTVASGGFAQPVPGSLGIAGNCIKTLSCG